MKKWIIGALAAAAVAAGAIWIAIKNNMHEKAIKAKKSITAKAKKAVVKVKRVTKWPIVM